MNIFHSADVNPIQRHTGSPLHTGEWISNQKEVVFGYTTRLCLSCPSEFQAVYDCVKLYAVMDTVYDVVDCHKSLIHCLQMTFQNIDVENHVSEVHVNLSVDCRIGGVT